MLQLSVPYISYVHQLPADHLPILVFTENPNRLLRDSSKGIYFYIYFSFFDIIYLGEALNKKG
jgi:hypothetical protein